MSAAGRHGWRVALVTGTGDGGDEIATLVAFLTNDGSSYVTGHMLPVNGSFLCT